MTKKFNEVIISMSNKHENRVRNTGDMVISFMNGNAGVWAYLSEVEYDPSEYGLTYSEVRSLSDYAYGLFNSSYSELKIDLTKKKVHYS
ncbi:MAG: hypothetical protein EWM50_02895 [Gottschalkiaceae bacterium]|nr:MAG: hypothetical protein EWM50_02895 [Gottschalkiaceae bacterium]